MGMPGVPHETHWRWRLDDGGEGSGGAGWHELEDVAHDFPTGELDVNVRLRFAIFVDSGDIANLRPQLQYNLNSSTFLDVDAISIVARSSGSGNFTDGDDTTEHPFADFGGAGSFFGNNDGMDDVDGSAGSSNTDIVAEDYLAVEYCFQLREADLSDNDAIEFRLVDNSGGVFSTYPSPHANCTIDLPGGAGPSIPVLMASYRRRHEAS